MDKNVHKLLFDTVTFPNGKLVAQCSACKAELAYVAWTSYYDHSLKKEKLQKKFDRCPRCKAVFNVAARPTWVKQPTGDWRAACRNGDFLVWRHGRVYKWRYRVYGNTYADQLGVSSSLMRAQKACEGHLEWRL